MFVWLKLNFLLSVHVFLCVVIFCHSARHQPNNSMLIHRQVVSVRGRKQHTLSRDQCWGPGTLFARHLGKFEGNHSEFWARWFQSVGRKYSSMEVAVIWGNSDFAHSDFNHSDFTHSDFTHSYFGHFFCQKFLLFSLNIYNLGTHLVHM